MEVSALTGQSRSVACFGESLAYEFSSPLLFLWCGVIMIVSFTNFWLWLGSIIIYDGRPSSDWAIGVFGLETWCLRLAAFSRLREGPSPGRRVRPGSWLFSVRSLCARPFWPVFGDKRPGYRVSRKWSNASSSSVSDTSPSWDWTYLDLAVETRVYAL